jgi:predicted kinase
MRVPLLIVVTGPPAGGKTTVAEHVAETLRLPLVTKDGIKETLFDSLGTGDREWSQRLGEATWHVLFDVVGAMLRGGAPLVVEGNFEPDYAHERFASLPGFRAIQVFCSAPDEVLLERYRERIEEGDRHPGHVDDDVERELGESLATSRWRPLTLDGPLVEVGPEDDAAEVAERIRALASST